MISSTLPLFPAVPLFAAALLILLRNKWLERLLLVGIPLASGIGGMLLLSYHRGVPAVAEQVGDYIPGVAIVFVSDSLTALMLTVTGLITAVAGSYLVISGEDRYRFVPSLVLMLLAGVSGALLTGDLFNLFVFVEVMLLPSYALIAVTGSWRRLGIGRMFVFVNLLTSTILVMGVGFVYGVSGTVNLAALAGSARENPMASLAGSIVLLALLVKAGVVPVHTWLPKAYPATSPGVMGLFSGLHTKVGLYAAYRVYAVIFGPAAAWVSVLEIIVVLTIIVGALSTFGVRRIRSALAFQMVAGVGQILIGIVVFTQLSVAAGLFYLVHHMITMGGLILASGAIESTYGSGRFDRLQGLMKREPLIATVMALGFASLVGLPPTSGLWGKVGLMLGSAGADRQTAVILLSTIIAASILSLLALQRVWRDVFWGPPMKEFQPDDPVTARGSGSRSQTTQ